MRDLAEAPSLDRGASPGERWLLAALLAWACGVRLWFAHTGLDHERFVDERYILDNVRSFLEERSLRPVHLYYPGLGNLLHSLLLGAADALARWTGRGGGTILRDDQFTPTAYLLSRGLQCCIGVLTIYWTYRIGRRLLSPRAGLLAALVLAAVPLHVRQSAVVKPDILMLLGLLIATEATAAALASGRLREFLGAGAAVGLATSGKYNGVAAAVPLALFALPRARREPAVLARLAAAGVAALLVFVLINPFFFSMLGRFQRDFSNTLEHYQAKSQADEPAPSHLGVLLATGPEMLAPNFHGVLTGLLGCAGLAFLAVQAWRRRDASLALPVAFPLVYVVLYAASTTYAKANNYLPVCPYLALGAAALVWEAGRRLRGGTAARIFTIATAAMAVWCATLVWRPMAYTYEQTVPDTLDVAEDRLGERLAALASSRVLYQVGALDRLAWVGDDDGRALVRDFPRLEQTAAPALDLADAEIYTPAALASPAAAGRVAAARPAGQVLRIGPRLFQARGEPLTILLHPWPAAGDPVELAMQRPGPGGAWTALPVGIKFPALISFEVIVPVNVDPPEAIVADGRRLPLFAGGRRDRRWLTERARFDRAPAEVSLPGVPADGKPPRLRLLPWAGR